MVVFNYLISFISFISFILLVFYFIAFYFITAKKKAKKQIGPCNNEGCTNLSTEFLIECRICSGSCHATCMDYTWDCCKSCSKFHIRCCNVGCDRKDQPKFDCSVCGGHCHQVCYDTNLDCSYSCVPTEDPKVGEWFYDIL